MIHSPTCQHALRALIYLAEKNSPGPVLVREIADKSRVPRQSLAKILHALRNKGLVRSTKGPGGGYRLARAGESMRVVEVIEAVDGHVELRKACVLGLDTVGAEHVRLATPLYTYRGKPRCVTVAHRTPQVVQL